MSNNKTSRKKITKSEIRKRIIELEAKIPTLEASAEDWGSCYINQRLGYTRGYLQALKHYFYE